MCILRVSKTEYELSDGSVFPIEPPLESEMSIEEFEKHYEFANKVIKSCRDVGRNYPDSTQLG